MTTANGTAPHIGGRGVQAAYLGSLVAGVTPDGQVELGFGSAAEVVTPALAREWAASIVAMADAADAARRNEQEKDHDYR
jgi:hypothetical protein